MRVACTTASFIRTPESYDQRRDPPEDHDQDHKPDHFRHDPVREKSYTLPDKRIGPEPPLGPAAQSLRAQPCKPGPDAASKDMVVCRHEDDVFVIRAAASLLDQQNRVIPARTALSPV